ncbi:MAG TPA: hypothetical protein VNA15_11495 [Candidatus Angelobacter sp.]|nr:hypothetical protein [Candidatus Angelobacter sp.]
MRLLWRIWFAGVGLFLVLVMAVAFIGVFNTWRVDSLPLPSAIVVESVIVAIFIGGVWSINIARRGTTRKRRSENPPDGS